MSSEKDTGSRHSPKWCEIFTKFAQNVAVYFSKLRHVRWKFPVRRFRLMTGTDIVFDMQEACSLPTKDIPISWGGN